MPSFPYGALVSLSSWYFQDAVIHSPAIIRDLYYSNKNDDANSGVLPWLWAVLGFPCGTVVKNLPANVGDSRDSSSTLEWGRSLRGGNGSPL